MKTLADFKRLPVGTKIETLEGIPKYQNKVRTIEHKQSNAIRFEGGSWLQYPSAKETTIESEDTIRIDLQTAEGKVWNTLRYRVHKVPTIITTIENPTGKKVEVDTFTNQI